MCRPPTPQRVAAAMPVEGPTAKHGRRLKMELCYYGGLPETHFPRLEGGAPPGFTRIPRPLCHAVGIGIGIIPPASIYHRDRTVDLDSDPERWKCVS